jgi:hypothetical protein
MAKIAKAVSANFIIYGVLLLLAILICAVGAWYAMMFQNLVTKEGFAVNEGLAFMSSGKETDCPLSAQRQPDGKIQVQPQNRSFDTMADYAAWLTSQAAAGSMCIPPMVKGPKEVDVIQGPGSPSADRTIAPSKEQINKQDPAGNVFTSQVEGEHTYAKTPINKVDDYEYTRVFQNENGPRGELSKTTVNSLTAKNQFDWAKLPFNSETRAAAETEFISGRKDSATREPKSGVFFKDLEGMAVNPPDEDSREIREKASMEPFKASPAEKLTEHKVEDVAEMVRKMYADDPNWEPVVEKVGENQYRVSELRPKARREKFKEDEDTTIRKAKDDGLISASVEVEGGKGSDPYFDKQGVLDYSNDRFWEYKDFKKWSGGLERMFAPTLDQTNWV